ncbi:hypothetical protein HALDL1_14105 [Halobacterium sp. DL1]|nr:hypothetical protein HALDL1_14105 [Halobacterium sp. DL1]
MVRARREQIRIGDNIRVVRREPWYALAAFLAGGAVVLAVA